jgi:hypothetical protein
MAMGSGLLALALMAADGPSCSPEETTTYQVKVLTLDGLDWRTTAYSRLTPVARQGTSAIWTADKTLATALAERASSVTTGGKILACGEAVLSQGRSVSYVAAMDRVADGPINQSTAIAFMPRPERIEERFAIRIAGRKLDQGVLTRLTLEETHIDVLHSVNQSESLKPENSKVKKTRISSEAQSIERSLGVAEPETEALTMLTGQVQIPEVSQTRIDGEWLIPKDGVLLISLGVKTIADEAGKAVVRERLAVIETNPSGELSVPWSNGGPSPVVKTSALVMPPTPTRTIPQSVDASGATVDLPPLPEALASNDLDRIKPEPNQPSPQSPLIAQPESDPSIARTGFDAAPAAPNPPFVEAAETTGAARMARLKKLQEALAKAGFDLDINVDANDLDEITLVKPVCEKCDGDTLFCPSDAKAMTQGEPAGGFKLAHERVAFGLTVKDVQGNKVQSADLKIEEALKNPGKTSTTLVPLSGRVSLEIKATLVPTAKATASKDKAATAH